MAIAYYTVSWFQKEPDGNEAGPFIAHTNSAKGAETLSTLLQNCEQCEKVSVKGVEDTEWPF